MNLNKLTSVLVILMLLVASTAMAGVSTRQTNLPVIDRGKALYGKASTGAEMKLIEADTNGALVQTITVDDFFTLEPVSAIDTSATTNATLTPLGSWQVIDTWQDESVSTVNTVTTANIPIGSIVIFSTVADARDVIFIETNNLSLGGTRTLSDTDDKLAIMKVSATMWNELFVVDNN